MLDIDLRDSADGLITRKSRAEDLASIPEDRYNPLTGPIYIEDAAPGDVLRIKIIRIETASWGWSAILPDVGILPDVFRHHALTIWDIDSVSRRVSTSFAASPLMPCVGTVGVAPDQTASLSNIPPHRGGGNIDSPSLVEGSEFWLPVHVQGGLVSFGDGHAAQGFGEVCGFGIECEMRLTVEVQLLKAGDQGDCALPTHTPHIDNNFTQQIQVIAPPRRHRNTVSTFGISDNFTKSARSAVLAMIETLVERTEMTREQAYMLCSAFGDLEVHSMVNEGKFVVSMSIEEDFLQKPT